MYKPISDYGVIGDLHSVALVARNGDIDWFCFPHIDSPAVFGALLDDRQGGTFALRPVGEFDSAAAYEPRTNVLVTRFRTRDGACRVVDFLALPATGPEDREAIKHVLYRLVEMERGTMELEVLFRPRFDYARAETVVEARDTGVQARGGGKGLLLAASRALEVREGEATGRWKMQEEERAVLRLGCSDETNETGGSAGVGDLEGKADRARRDTEEFWRQWLSRSETGRSFSLGAYRDVVERSALALKLLHFHPTGAIAAAATTSLPERVGGERNWDYRFSWIRDSSFTLDALFNLGHVSETEGYLRWIEEILSADDVGELQIMYGLRGERDLPEEELDHLDGYKGSRPVRIGNAAAGQVQLDIYGELMDAALKLSDYVGKISEEQWPILEAICEHVCGHWRDRDSGIWEVRGPPRHFVYSKVMCWVALDRGVTIAERYGFGGDLNRWRGTMETIRSEVLDQGFDGERNAFVQYYGGDVLDSSNLLLPVFGFLPFDDPRVVSTVEATMEELSHDGLLYRYRGEDGLEGEEGTFLLCTFWLANCLTRLGRLAEAERLLSRLGRTANHLGLFAEEYDVTWQEALGNFPQAFTHIGCINSVVNLLQAKERARARERGPEQEHSFSFREFVDKKLLASKIVLNEGLAECEGTAHEVAAQLKSRMNLLRGAFFDSERGRVAYERMKDSETYADYAELSRCLQEVDPGSLRSRDEKIAFWINLYNVLVVHGVVALDVKDSIKEVRSFLRRVRYDVGGHPYSPDHVEHGILRGNRKPPHTLFRVFGDEDPRAAHSLEEMDPRIHFALVCASSSCPPIALYAAEDLDDQLDRAARSFLTGGGLKVHRDDGRVRLSRIFKWYGTDFASDEEELLVWLSDYLHDPGDRTWLREHAGEVKVEYQHYDWRLNRT